MKIFDALENNIASIKDALLKIYDSREYVDLVNKTTLEFFAGSDKSTYDGSVLLIWSNDRFRLDIVSYSKPTGTITSSPNLYAQIQLTGSETSWRRFEAGVDGFEELDRTKTLLKPEHINLNLGSLITKSYSQVLKLDKNANNPALYLRLTGPTAENYYWFYNSETLCPEALGSINEEDIGLLPIIRLFGEVGDEMSKDLLFELTNSTSYDIRWEAILSGMQLDAERFTSLVKHASAYDKHPDVRQAAKKLTCALRENLMNS